ncbi:MAG TPA: hypothetical protein VKY27_07250 [Bacteriovoracaceae bacterium]|nr:hypothetical protein [Bacteriovoracaceae bacterium]
MEIESVIEKLRAIVKNAGNVDQNHLDLNLVPSEKRDEYVEALKFSYQAIKDGVITKDEFLRKLKLNK